MLERSVMTFLYLVLEGEHRAMNRDHPRALDQGVKQKSDVGESDQRLRREAYRVEIDEREDPPRSVAAAGNEDRADVGIGEKRHQVLGAVAIASGQDVIAIEHAIGDPNPEADFAQQPETALYEAALDRGRRRYHTDGVARLKRQRLFRRPFHLAHRNRHIITPENWTNQPTVLPAAVTALGRGATF